MAGHLAVMYLEGVLLYLWIFVLLSSSNNFVLFVLPFACKSCSHLGYRALNMWQWYFALITQNDRAKSVGTITHPPYVIFKMATMPTALHCGLKKYGLSLLNFLGFTQFRKIGPLYSSSINWAEMFFFWFDLWKHEVSERALAHS